MAEGQRTHLQADHQETLSPNQPGQRPLLRVASAASADLVVVGNRGMTGMRRFVLGSVPNKVAHNCSASVLIVDTSHARA